MDINKIKLNKQTQSRVTIDKDVVAEYAEAMIEGAIFPPVEVFYDGIDYYLVDGYHRYFASKKSGVNDIEVKVHNGSLRDAVLYAVGVNNNHGLRRTAEDRRKAVMTLLDDLEWAEWSDRVIAKHSNMSSMTVGRIRKSLQLEQTEKKYITKHGTEATINTGKIAESNRDRIVEEPDSQEDHIQELANTNVELAAELTPLQQTILLQAFLRQSYQFLWQHKP